MKEQQKLFTRKELQAFGEFCIAKNIDEIKWIRRWLKDIVWCNAHDKAWIEETIKKLKEIK